jgi:hypothetical protein
MTPGVKMALPRAYEFYKELYTLVKTSKIFFSRTIMAQSKLISATLTYIVKTRNILL